MQRFRQNDRPLETDTGTKEGQISGPLMVNGRKVLLFAGFWWMRRRSRRRRRRRRHRRRRHLRRRRRCRQLSTLDMEKLSALNSIDDNYRRRWRWRWRPEINRFRSHFSAPDHQRSSRFKTFWQNHNMLELHLAGCLCFFFLCSIFSPLSLPLFTSPFSLSPSLPLFFPQNREWKLFFVDKRFLDDALKVKFIF